jgi:hypothetical protein
MARIQIDPDADVGTKELRNRDIWDGTVRFASTGTSQELPGDVAEQFVDEYADLVPYETAEDADETPDENENE